MNIKYKKYLGISLSIIGSIISAIIIHFIYYYFIFYIHEAGHILFGSIGSLIMGIKPNFYISNWMNYELLPFLKIPQQTIVTPYTFILPYGGIIMTLLMVSLISYILSKSLKNKLFLYFIPLFVFHEIILNFLFGTDNWLRAPLIPKLALGNIFNFFSILLIILIIYPLIKKTLIKSTKHNF